MPVLDAVQTFAGITNENEFYSHHYLAEVFGKDIESRLAAWEAAAGEGSDAAAAQDSGATRRAPPKALAACAQRWFTLRGQLGRTRDAQEKWALFSQAQGCLLHALGYPAPQIDPIPLCELRRASR